MRRRQNATVGRGRPMNILLLSHGFHPSVGGTEEVGRILATQFSEMGHGVRVATQTPAGGEAKFPFEIIRQPATGQLLRLASWCDVFFQSNISLRTAWSLLAVRRPFVIAHHTWIARVDGRIGVRDWIKRALARRATNIAVSGAIARSIGAPATVIGNPYRNELFRILPGIERQRDFIFVGRLVSDKGVDLLIEALATLAQQGLRPSVTIVGSGPEDGALRDRCAQAGLDSQVQFAGVLRGEELVQTLNRHRFIVIPSRWQEPFGLVALEGAACGCRPIVAQSGALPEAAGPGAIVFERGSSEDLGLKMAAALNDREDRWRPSAEHLEKHRARAVALRYLEVFEEALKRQGRG